MVSAFIIRRCRKAFISPGSRIDPRECHPIGDRGGNFILWGYGDLMNWKKIDILLNRPDIPVVACCYAIYFDGILKYIGSTGNLRNRFSGHAIRFGFAKNIHTPWGVFPDSVQLVVKYKPSRSYGDWLMLEARLIRRIKPIFNKKLKGRAA